ncbi:SRPBCC family protein [Streptomyces sp. NBC_01803]|uniref:SRPBCC family protein n=1 Tax=Streptomyces sp. NBC_01803 TaxID=2975946 RepID=UPI002DDAFC5D|nr:SRPBCC family protein [Streptomyces sp. NBC_01803]WSA47338.1 SRPBCC family protein [Streptomyces sp. NBC_01803]
MTRTDDFLMGHTRHASRVIDVPVHRVLDTLLDPLALPAWNPAIRRVRGPSAARPGATYTITLRGLPGHLTYDETGPRRVAMRWRMPGFAEDGTWQLQPGRQGVVVSHDFTHRGPLASLLEPAYREVAELRLERLARRVSGAGTDSTRRATAWPEG